MIRRIILCIWAILPYCLYAQTDAKASEVLDKAFAIWKADSGIRAEFGGNENGVLLLKGEKFYLSNGTIESWYDGETQWSYVADTEEVNISHPTPEELQSINPYHILMRYKTDFHYIYKGSQTRNGVKGHEIILTPKHSNREIFRLFISNTYQPLAIKIEQNGQTVSEINVTRYETNQKFGGETFRFNKLQYPNAEIIDLR